MGSTMGSAWPSWHRWRPLYRPRITLEQFSYMAPIANSAPTLPTASPQLCLLANRASMTPHLMPSFSRIPITNAHWTTLVSLSLSNPAINIT